MFISQGDLLLTILFAIGLFQWFWLSVVLVRQGINPSSVRHSLLIMLSVWVLIWPAYENTLLPLLSLTILIIPFAFVLFSSAPFSRHLRLCWHTTPRQAKQPAAWLTITLSFMICTGLFSLAPELGLGLALSLCFASNTADLADKSGKGKRLGFAKNPQQTLAGHLVFVLATSLICAWSLQLYHGIPWQQFLIATMIVGLLGSMTRALIATGWNMPLSVLAMAAALWLL